MTKDSVPFSIWPGLLNHGNTCFFNSIIQSLKAIGKLRNELKAMQPFRSDRQLCREMIVAKKLAHIYNLDNATQPLNVDNLISSFIVERGVTLNGFGGCTVQQDANEFMNYLLQDLSEPPLNLHLPSVQTFKGLYQKTVIRNGTETQSEGTKPENMDGVFVHFTKPSWDAKGHPLLDKEGIQETKPISTFMEGILYGNQFEPRATSGVVDQFLELPKLLRTLIMRFTQDSERNWTKNLSNMPIELEIDIKGLCTQAIREMVPEVNTKYELISVISHEGAGRNEGHYRAYSRSGDDKNIWYRCDDAHVTSVNSAYDQSLSQGQECAYILLYSLIEGSNDPMKNNSTSTPAKQPSKDSGSSKNADFDPNDINNISSEESGCSDIDDSPPIDRKKSVRKRPALKSTHRIPRKRREKPSTRGPTPQTRGPGFTPPRPGARGYHPLHPGPEVITRYTRGPGFTPPRPGARDFHSLDPGQDDDDTSFIISKMMIR